MTSKISDITKKTISIAMTSYNGEKYIRDQINSYYLQSLPFDELVICDDNSTDTTWEILKEYAKKDDKIKIYQNKKNIGFVKNFEKAIRLCSCDLIALSDQDDIWAEDHLKILKNNLGEKMVSVGNAMLINHEGKDLGISLSYATHLDFVPENDLDKAFFIIYYISQYHGMTMMIKREFFQLALPIPDSFEYHDRWFALLACFYGGLNYTHEIVTLYRRLNISQSGIKKRDFIPRVLISHLYHKDFNVEERLSYLNEIKNKLTTQLNEKQLLFITKAEIYYKRKKNLIGRIKNLIFELINLSLIYGISKKEMYHIKEYLKWRKK